MKFLEPPEKVTRVARVPLPVALTLPERVSKGGPTKVERLVLDEREALDVLPPGPPEYDAT